MDKALPLWTNIGHLELDTCGLRKFPEIISDLKTLTCLSLRGNREICDLPDSMKNLIKLRQLFVSDCGLHYFPDIITHLTAMVHIDISNNNISVLPMSLRNLRNLHSIFAINCNLTFIEDFGSPGMCLKTLQIDKNPMLSDIPLSIRHLQPIEFLSTVNNNFVKIPEWIPSLTSVVKLCLQENPVATLPDAFANLVNLQHLNLSDCALRGFPEIICNLKKLQYIYMQNNLLIQTLPESVSNLKLVIELDVSRCGIRIFPSFLLEYGTANCIVKCSKNRILVLEEATITRMVEKNVTMAAVRERFDFNFVHLKKPPPPILQNGLEACLQYYKDLTLRGATNYHLQSMVLLGNTMAGKTSILKTIELDDRYLAPEFERTVLVENAVIREGSIQLNVADFGGHHIYEMTCPLFLRAGEQLVIICVDLSQHTIEQHDDMVTKWIHTALSSMQSGRIIIAATKTDQCETGGKYVDWEHYTNWQSNTNLFYVRYLLDQANLGENHLYRKLHTLKYCTDNWKEKELAYQRRMIEQAENDEYARFLRKQYDFLKSQDLAIVPTCAREQPWGAVNELRSIIWSHAFENAIPIPTSWKPFILTLSELIDRGEKSWISIVDLERMHGRKSPNKATEQFAVEDCLEVLSQCGMILWFRNREGLKNIIFHDVSKVVAAFKYVFHHDLAREIKKKIATLDENWESPHMTTSEIEQHVKHFQQSGILSNQLLNIAWW